MYHPQMRHYTIYNGEQRYSPAPFSPPPSPPKSEMWSTAKSDKPYSYNNMEVSPKLNTQRSHVHQPSTSNLNYCAYPSASCSTCHRSNDFATNTTRVAQHYPNYLATAEESSKISNVSNDTKNSQPETKKLSRMSINYVLDNPHDEPYEDTSPASTNTDYETEIGKEIDRRVYAGRKRRCRKNPYPMRAPSKDAPGINLKVDVYTPVMKDPAAILRSNDTSAASSPTDTVDSQTISLEHFSSSQSIVSLVESNDESTTDGKQNAKSKDKKLVKRQQRPKARRSGAAKPERKRKGNSLARVMTDRGLLDSVFNTGITSTDIKLVRIPPPPPMQHHELMAVIKELNIDHSVLDNYNMDISWKGQPLNIAHLPHYKELHETEAKVVSILRLTPVQYLTGKHTLVSAARRYVQRALPFKKSDAQKLLRIDVNKASKLWEFFRRIKWI